MSVEGVVLQERQPVMNEYGLEPQESQTCIDFKAWSLCPALNNLVSIWTGALGT